jgi:hypothetical protein
VRYQRFARGLGPKEHNPIAVVIMVLRCTMDQELGAFPQFLWFGKEAVDWITRFHMPFTYSARVFNLRRFVCLECLSGCSR